MSMVKAGRELFLTAILATFIFLAPSATHVFAVEYAVGVTVGDYVMYTVSVSWVPEWNVTGPEPFSVTYYRLIQWMKVEVQNVSGTEVKIVTTTHYTDEETRVASIIDVKEGPRKGQFSLALIAANLEKGDPVTSHSDAPVLNDTVTRRCAGASRRVNVLDITQTFNDYTYSTVGEYIPETYRNIVY